MQVHLVDGTYELFRAYFGAPRAEAPDGGEVGAVRGLARSLLALVTREAATHVAVAFDHTVESFRNDLFAGYKTGEGLEPELRAQFEPAERITAALGIVVWPLVEFEADDGLATGAARYAADRRVEQVVICSPDKDVAQCVRDARVVCHDRRRGQTLDEEGVRRKFGIEPASIPDYLALVGDAADGIPGVPRWGARSAAAALAVHRHLDRIPANPAEWTFRVRGAAALAEQLAAHREQARLYRTLATLREDVPLAESLEDLRWRGADRALLEAECAALGETRLVERVPRWRASG